MEPAQDGKCFCRRLTVSVKSLSLIPRERSPTSSCDIVVMYACFYLNCSGVSPLAFIRLQKMGGNGGRTLFPRLGSLTDLVLGYVTKSGWVCPNVGNDVSKKDGGVDVDENEGGEEVRSFLLVRALPPLFRSHSCTCWRS